MVPVETTTTPHSQTSQPQKHRTGACSSRSTGLRQLQADITNPKVIRALHKINTSPSYKVTGNTKHIRVLDDDDANLINITTDDVHFAFTSVGGIDYDAEIDDEDQLLDMFIMHTCIQSDPGEHTN